MATVTRLLGVLSVVAILYSPSVEVLADDEAETFEKIEQGFVKISDAGREKQGHDMRASHAKATGLLTGSLRILDNLPQELAQGIAARPGQFEALVRFAQGPGELLEDRISTHRGMAIKILGVSGPRVSQSLEEATQDFVLEPGPAFIHSTPKTFLADFNAGVSNAPSLPMGVKSAVSNVARATNALIGNSGKILGFLGHPSVHPLAENYFSQAPVRWGDHVGKVAMVVSQETLDAIGNSKIDASEDPNAFRHTMVDYFQQHEAVFEFRVQLNTDFEEMPIEDSSVEWSQDFSSYQTVAILILPAQSAYSEERRQLYDERLSFSPANGLEDHRPLGGIMRARLAIYPHMARRRGAASFEPQTISDATEAKIPGQ